jgi:hypothetical protein
MAGPRGCPALTKLDPTFGLGETLSRCKWTEMSNPVNNESTVR